jgi:hypothetical protein
VLVKVLRALSILGFSLCNLIFLLLHFNLDIALAAAEIVADQRVFWVAEIQPLSLLLALIERGSNVQASKFALRSRLPALAYWFFVRKPFFQRL